jgi:hypothetical protein
MQKKGREQKRRGAETLFPLCICLSVQRMFGGNTGAIEQSRFLFFFVERGTFPFFAFFRPLFASLSPHSFFLSLSHSRCTFILSLHIHLTLSSIHYAAHVHLGCIPETGKDRRGHLWRRVQGHVRLFIFTFYDRLQPCTFLSSSNSIAPFNTPYPPFYPHSERATGRTVAMKKIRLENEDEGVF